MKARWETHVAALGMAALALLAGGMPPAKAQTITLDAEDPAGYDDTGFHEPTNQNYLTGRFVRSGGQVVVEHNFFVFDSPVFALPIASVELRLFNPATGFASPDPTEIHTLRRVHAHSRLACRGHWAHRYLRGPGSGRAGYRSQVVSAANNNSLVTIGLNPSGVTALSNATGGLFALGGAITTLRPGSTANEHLFSATNFGTETRQLVVTLIPEPGTLTLLGTGTLTLLGCGWRRRRRAA